MSAARIVQWTSEQYHAESRRVSNSMLRDFRESRGRYHAVHVSGDLPGREQTPAMLLGSIVDDLIFPTRDFPRYVAAPKVDRRTNAGKTEWAEFSARLATMGQIAAPADTMATALAMVEALRTSALAQSVLSLGGKEQPAIIWDDAETGLPCRALPDLVIPGAGLVVDLKTTTDVRPDRWAKKLADFEYHCQAAWYCEAARLVGGEGYTFAHLVVSTVATHEVALYPLATPALNLGASINHDTLVEREKAIRLDEWRAKYELEPQVIDLPRWYYSREG